MQSVKLSSESIPPGIQLADPELYSSKPVDLLIGSEIFWQILMENKILQCKNRPHFQETLLGFIAGGVINCNPIPVTACHFSLFTRRSGSEILECRGNE